MRTYEELAKQYLSPPGMTYNDLAKKYLSPPIYFRFIKNTNNHRKGLINENCGKRNDFITNCFWWSQTPEGSAYWSDIDESYLDRFGEPE